MRAAETTVARLVEFGEFTLQLPQRVLLRGQDEVRIGSRALEILVTLLESPGAAVPKAVLIARTWPSIIVEEAALRVQIANLRKTLGDGEAQRRYVVNVAGQGYRFVAPVRIREAPGMPPHGGVSHTIPVRLTRTIGRARYIDDLVDRLPRQRFLTLVGPGGTGKTTVAVDVAHRVSRAYADGVLFIDLASVHDLERVASMLAAVFGLPILSDNPLSTFLQHISDKHIVLVLDNCEHIIETIAEVAELALRSGPRLHVLATSREPLRADGEWVCRLPPLELPAPETVFDAEKALAYSAVELFVERVSAQNIGYQMTDNDATRIVEICRRLDGLPLAIELAAGCVGTFGISELATRLRDGLHMLHNGRRTVLPRQRTLRATLDWSFETLKLPERLLLCRLAVFAAPFSTVAAIRVVGYDALKPEVVIDGLTALTSKSLLEVVSVHDQMEYSLLQTTRVYAMDKLQQSGEIHELQRRRAAMLVGSEYTDPLLSVAAQRRRHGFFLTETRTALEWCFGEQGDATLGIALAAHSAPLWLAFSFLGEYRRYIDRALHILDERGGSDPQVELSLHLAMGQVLLYALGPGPTVAAEFARAAEIAEHLGDDTSLRKALWGAWAERIRGADYPAALRFAEQCQRLPRTDPDDGMQDRILSVSHHFTGHQISAQHHARAVLTADIDSLTAAATTVLEYDFKVGAFSTLARSMWICGQAEQALETIDRGVAYARTLGHTLSLCYVLASAVGVRFWCGDDTGARGAIDELTQWASRYSIDYWEHWARCLDLVHSMRSEAATLRCMDGVRATTLHTPQHDDFLPTFDIRLLTDAALERAKAGAVGWCAPELLRAKAESLMHEGRGQLLVAESLLLHSLELARGQSALGWELRAATSLARLRVRQNRGHSAREMLQSVLRRFVEGHSTRDVRVAQELLGELEQSKTPSTHDRSSISYRD